LLRLRLLREFGIFCHISRLGCVAKYIKGKIRLKKGLLEARP